MMSRLFKMDLYFSVWYAKINIQKVESDWESEYLASPHIEKFSMKLESGELLALGAYQITGRKAYI